MSNTTKKAKDGAGIAGLTLGEIIKMTADKIDTASKSWGEAWKADNERLNITPFCDSWLIVSTRHDSSGNSYSAEGVLNQAAWIGEHAGALLKEINFLRQERYVLAQKLAKSTLGSMHPKPQ